MRRSKLGQPWRLAAKDSSTPSKSMKAWSFTNLVNGGDERNQNGDGLNFEFGNRRVKSKRGTAVKRVRSYSNSKIEFEEEGFRELDPELDPSPVQSLDNVGLDMWNGPREDNNDDDNMLVMGAESSSSGVRSWLIELGLSRYAPVFEIHEVDAEVLPMLTLEDLKDMGINAVGSRRKMFTAILKLRNRFSS